MLKLRFALVAALIAYGAYNHHHYKTVCGGTDNPALCELNIQAGETDEIARNAGNGIFN